MAKTGDDLLNERLAQAGDNNFDVQSQTIPQPSNPGEVAAPSPVATSFDFVQWSAEPNEVFRAAGKAQQYLPAGVYGMGVDNRGVYFQRKRVVTDALIELDDSASIQVIAGIRTFWNSKVEYTKRSIVYKRGVLLWGPAGSGKTATLMLMTQELVQNNGIVILCDNPALTVAGLEHLRRIEPERPLIVIFEDIDELIRRYSEHDILALLDGESQVSNVVNIATTNYPEQLGARIVNRPSRFDERIFVDMPSAIARRKYLIFATKDEDIKPAELDRWVRETEHFSVAHLRELVVAVFCLKQDYQDVIERLSKMRVQPKSGREFGSGGETGFRTAKEYKIVFEKPMQPLRTS